MPRRFRHVAVEGTWFRLVRSGRDPLDFARTANAGGRYNPPRSHPTLYLGDQPATCLLEVLVHAYEIPATYDIVAVDVKLPRVADLSNDRGRVAARVALEDLVAPPDPIIDARGAIIGTEYGPTWQIGRAAWKRGVDGLLVPSAALPVQRVLVVLQRPSQHLVIRDRHPVPTDPRMRRLFEPRARHGNAP
jgi:RES domain-containing protein